MKNKKTQKAQNKFIGLTEKKHRFVSIMVTIQYMIIFKTEYFWCFGQCTKISSVVND